MNFTVLTAIFKRDFVSYFSSPTGYLFICAFVAMSAIATFFPPEFFNNNLANLDQLTWWMPAIMLLFIPAITMSSWAEERRQGTDELLLTIPATDIDVVLGKYLAALAIFTVSLLFSMFSIFLIFAYGLGEPDWGLFACTYFGYWLVGASLLSVGMVASFLTRNLTVGFVMGMLFIAPFALAGVADWVVKDPDTAQLISRWSVANQFQDFQRGVISLASVSYFVILTVVMLYLCMVLIGRRHWGTGEEGDSRWGHYFARFAALVLIAGGLNVILSNHFPYRHDATAEKINSLSDNTKAMLADLRNNDEVKPITVDVFVSPKVPSEYAAQKLDLLGTLREIESRSDGKVQANVYEVETFSPQAQTAEQSYGIEPQVVFTTVRGRPDRDEIFMGLAVTSGLDKVVVPFVDKGISPEYELVRSIMTVADAKRKRVGVVSTGVNMFSEFTMQGESPKSEIIAELEKQYEVVQVDPSEPITDTYDVLLAVQPSQLTPDGMKNFIDSIKRGQPVAIFEDPLPSLWPSAVATGEPNVQGGGPMAMFGGGGQEVPKGNLEALWDLLGVRLLGSAGSMFGGPSTIDVVLQDYNPYTQYQAFFNNQFVFVDQGLAETDDAVPFNPDSEISAGMRQVLFLRPGALLNDEIANREVTALASTGTSTVTAPYSALQRFDPNDSLQIDEKQYTNKSYLMAVAVEGEIEADADLSLKAPGTESANGADDSKDDVPLEQQPLKAVVVADIDCLGDDFFRLRARGDQGDGMPELTFQNVSFVLNVLDWLAGDERYIDLRKRSRAHRFLTGIDKATKDYRDQFEEVEKSKSEDAQASIEKARSELTEALDKLEARTDVTPEQKTFLERQIRSRIGTKVENKVKRLVDEREKEVRQAQRTLEQQINGEQNKYKRYALLLPPVLPILLGLYIFFHRRNREREGVSKHRLRFLSEDDKLSEVKKD